MIHGDIVTITSGGILVHDKALQPLGIFDKSVCWGVWSANPFESNRNGDANKQYKYPNLVISPIHPSSWPFLLQLEISMSDKEGAFADVCKLLNDSGLTILYLECTTAGFTHAFCNVIAESTKESLKTLRIQKQEFDGKYRHVRISDKIFKEAQEIANGIAAEMFAHAKELEVDLNTKDKYSFLHSWETERDSHLFLYDENKVAELIKEVKEIKVEIAPDDRIQYLKEQFPRTAKVHYMQRLAYFSMYGGGPTVPFSLTYRADSALLEFQEKISAPTRLKIYGQSEAPFVIDKLPLQAISIFNTQEKYLRLKPLNAEILNKNLTKIDVDYEVIQADRYTNPPQTSKGLFRQIGEQLRVHSVNLLHVDNKATRYDFNQKSGGISFVADVSEGDYLQVRESIKRITPHPNLKDVTVQDVKVYPYPELRLFVSLHFGFKREKEFRRLIETISKEYGFEGIIAEGYVDSSTTKVLGSIDKCQAFLQIISLRDDEELCSVNFPWLLFEHGVAAGKGLPTIRMVDLLKGTLDDWVQKLSIQKDQSLMGFRSNDAPEDIEAKISKAIGDIAQELITKTHVGR